MITNTVAKGRVSFFCSLSLNSADRTHSLLCLQNKTVSHHCIAHPDDYPFFIFLIVSFSSSTCLLLVYLSSLRLPVLSSSTCLLFVHLSSPSAASVQLQSFAGSKPVAAHARTGRQAPRCEMSGTGPRQHNYASFCGRRGAQEK